MSERTHYCDKQICADHNVQFNFQDFTALTKVEQYNILLKIN